MSAVRITAFKQPIDAFTVDSHTWRAIIGIDLDVQPGEYPIDVDATSGERRYTLSWPLAVAAKAFPTRRLSVAPVYVDPPPDALRRIQDEAALLTRLWVSSPSHLWKDTFRAPVREPATSAFGSRSVFNGEERNPHSGADFPSPTGTPIAAPGAGRVVFAGNLYFTGNSVVVDHGGGVVSLFAHLSSIAAAKGDFVEEGQIIGRVGATGRVTGAHLHWSVRANGARVDPLSLLAVLGGSAAP